MILAYLQVTRVRNRALNKPAPQLHTITYTNCVANTRLYLLRVSMTKGYSIFIMRGSSVVRSVTSTSARMIPTTYATAPIVWRIISPLQIRLDSFVLRIVSLNATPLWPHLIQSSDIMDKISMNFLWTIEYFAFEYFETILRHISLMWLSICYKIFVFFFSFQGLCISLTKWKRKINVIYT